MLDFCLDFGKLAKLFLKEIKNLCLRLYSDDTQGFKLLDDVHRCLEELQDKE